MGLASSKQEAFWEACGFGHLERAKCLLQEGDVDVNWVSYTNDCTPIHVASQGKLEIVKLLLQHNCNVNVQDNRGNLPLHHAAMKGHADIVEVLLEAGSEINVQEKNGWTALHNASYWSHPQVVNLLLKYGCDVNVQNKDGRTALHECARSQQNDERNLGNIARTLISAGSDVNSKSSDWGECDLTGLMYAAFHNHPDVAHALIDAKCELNSVGTTYWTALHWAADQGNEELVYILLDAGIDPTIRDMRGETAMHRAKSETVREFLASAIDLYKDLHKVKHPAIMPVSQMFKTDEPFKPKCDANFKTKSFLPASWKPAKAVTDKTFNLTSFSLHEEHMDPTKENRSCADIDEAISIEETNKTKPKPQNSKDIKSALTDSGPAHLKIKYNHPSSNKTCDTVHAKKEDVSDNESLVFNSNDQEVVEGDRIDDT